MPYLIISEPINPLMKDSPRSRLQYRVVLDNGRAITLKDVARQSKIPYPSLAVEIRRRELPIGVKHYDVLGEIIRDVQRRTWDARRARQQNYNRPGADGLTTCPHCSKKFSVGRTSENIIRERESQPPQE